MDKFELLKDAVELMGRSETPGAYYDRIHWLTSALMKEAGADPTPDDAPIPPCPDCK